MARYGITRWLIGGLCLIAAACAVGPDFHRPAPPAVRGYTQAPTPAATAGSSGPVGEVQRFVPGQDIPGQWWVLYRSSALDTLMRRALARNADLEAAQAALRQANELYYASRGSLLPQLQAGYEVNRQKNAASLSPTLSSGQELFTLHTAQLSVSYLLDIFGGARRQVESQRALAQAQQYQLQAAYLTLTANVVNAAVQEASLRAQVAATEQMVASAREALAILRRQNALGSIAMTDVQAQESVLATTEAGLPPLRKQLEQQRHLLAVLGGEYPGEGPAERFELAALTLPRELPVSLPSRLVRQRPDVLAAEAQLHAASAQVGVAIADMLPQITLSATAGGASTALSELFTRGNSFWTAGASLSQTLFQGGTLLHRKRAADAALDQAGAQYRSVVLAALQQVADALTAVQLDAESLVASERAAQAARQTLAATRRNVEIGLSSHLALLGAEQSYAQAELAHVQAEAARLADTAALFQALGGGWWNRTGAGG